MINYAKHDEEFYGLFKLTSGEEIVGKAVITEDNNESLIFITDPVVIEIFTKELENGKVTKGMGFSHWMQLSDEEFFILREKDIISVASLGKEYIVMYEAYISGENPLQKNRKKIDLDRDMGYLGRIDEARKLFERIYKNPSQP